MVTIRMAGAAMALVGTLLWVGAAHATSPVVKCQEQKLKARGKLDHFHRVCNCGHRWVEQCREKAAAA